jgi:FkbM family methyltransferase
MLRTFLGRINHSIIWKKSINVWGASFLPPTLDRWLALQAHRLGLMGTGEIQFLRRSVQPDWHIGDVGANQGLYTLLFSRLAFRGQVYAFEPDPSLFASLEENVRQNQAQNITLFNAAAASQAGKLLLRPGQLNRGDNRIIASASGDDHTIEIKAVSLDQIIPGSRLDLLKVDVQGFEVEVLRGAAQILRTNPALLILLEFWPHGLRLANSDPSELIDLLKTSGFALFRPGKNGLVEPFVYQAAAWQRPDQFCDLVASRSKTFPNLGL